MISIIENILALPDGKRKYVMDKKYTIAVAGTGYVAENRRKQQKSMSLSLTSETAVEYTI